MKLPDQFKLTIVKNQAIVSGITDFDSFLIKGSQCVTAFCTPETFNKYKSLLFDSNKTPLKLNIEYDTCDALDEDEHNDVYETYVHFNEDIMSIRLEKLHGTFIIRIIVLDNNPHQLMHDEILSQLSENDFCNFVNPIFESILNDMEGSQNKYCNFT